MFKVKLIDIYRRRVSIIELVKFNYLILKISIIPYTNLKTSIAILLTSRLRKLFI